MLFYRKLTAVFILLLFIYLQIGKNNSERKDLRESKVTVMKKITAVFSNSEDGELCLMRLAPYISSYSIDVNEGNYFLDMTTPDCGLNSYWGVDTPGFMNVSGYTARPRHMTANIDYLNKFESNVKKIVRQFGGRIESGDS